LARTCAPSLHRTQHPPAMPTSALLVGGAYVATASGATAAVVSPPASGLADPRACDLQLASASAAVSATRLDSAFPQGHIVLLGLPSLTPRHRGAGLAKLTFPRARNGDFRRSPRAAVLSPSRSGTSLPPWPMASRPHEQNCQPRGKPRQCRVQLRLLWKRVVMSVTKKHRPACFSTTSTTSSSSSACGLWLWTGRWLLVAGGLWVNRPPVGRSWRRTPPRKRRTASGQARGPPSHKARRGTHGALRRAARSPRRRAKSVFFLLRVAC
jgi:hypothetical protein